jgi:WD40 repeat protein
LYDLSQSPPERRAAWAPPAQGPGRDDDDGISDVAFTPDGRRVAGLVMNMIAIWDATTGDQCDTLERGMSSSGDCLAVSPDGRWLANTQPAGAGVSILDISPPGP